MRFLKNLTFLVFFFFSVNVLADTFTVTPTQLNISCLTQYAPSQTGRLVSCDADDSFIPTPVGGAAHCVEPSAFPFGSKQLDNEDFTEDYTDEIPPVSLNFSPALIDVNIVWE